MSTIRERNRAWKAAYNYGMLRTVYYVWMRRYDYVTQERRHKLADVLLGVNKLTTPEVIRKFQRAEREMNVAACLMDELN